MTDFVRRMGIVALLGCLGAPAAAAPRAQFTAAKELPSYFGAEVGRAVAEALDQVDARDADVTGRVEELPGERVRLVASIKGKNGTQVTVDGAFEEIDALCVQLASKIYPLVAPEKPARAEAARPAEKRSGALLAAASPVAVVSRKSEPERKPEIEHSDKKPESSRPSASPDGARKAESSRPSASPDGARKAESSRPSASPDGARKADKPAPVPVAAIGGVSAPAPTPPAPPAAPPATAPAAASTAHPPSDPPKRRLDDELLHPYAGGNTPPAPPAPTPYYVRSRVVAHTIADSPNAWPGAGRSATHALYDFLGRRLRLSVVPTGIGLTPPNVAMDEGVRSAARAVIMARLHSVEDRGMSLRCRLEVVVVRDGNVAMRRIIEAEAMRRVQEDPLFVATSQALEAISADLNAAVAEIR